MQCCGSVDDLKAPVATSRRGGAAVGGAPSGGLVEEATSHSPGTRITDFPGKTQREMLAQLARHRRVRRMRRCVTAHADSVRDLHGFRSEGIFVTLTYREAADWNPRQVTRYVQIVRDHFARRGIKLRYQWVHELQQRGAPHYHLVFWVPKGTRLPKPDESGQWPHGSSRIEIARKPVGYLVKYATKGTDDLPMLRGARLFGCGGEPSARFAAHRAGLPSWLNTAATPSARLERVPFVGWLESDTGAIHHSPFTVGWQPYPGGVRLIVTDRRVDNA